MASNRTGLTPGKGKPADWIELKNTSADSIDLEGFGLAVVKNLPDSVKANSEMDSVKTWTFPSVKIAGGEYLVVFADKSKEEKEKDGGEKKDKEKNKDKVKDLIADFKLPKEGGKVMFLAPDGDVLSEVSYGKLGADQSLSRQPDSTYVATYWQSPGFENTKEGYEKALEKIDAQRKSPILIWELMSRAADSKENWVELKNVSDKEISLEGYKLQKKPGKKEEGWALPAKTLAPGQIITFQLVGPTARPGNETHAGIKLGGAETIVLTKDGKFVDGMCAKLTPIGGSIGRAEGKKGFFFYSTPTRNAENGTGGKRFIAENPKFDHNPGIYTKQDTLCIRLKDKKQTVRYTLDGSEPTPSSPVLKDSLLLTKGTVVRTYAEGDSSSLKSNIATATYLLGVEHDMPVINIAMNKNDLYDYNTGIYADGPGYSPQWPHLGANFWKKWTRKAHVEMFDDKDGFSADCGIKIFGGYSRYEAKKSFCLKFKGVYGNKEADYDFFGTGEPMELQDLVLRSGSQDWNRCMIRDEFFTSLMQKESPTILTQMYRPVALYINAEYFGLYYIREKIDKHFVARKLDLPSNDSINIIMSIGYNEEGSKIPYTQLMKYVASHDMTNKEHYEYMKNNVDLQALIDYKLGEIFSGNTDVGNIRYVRSTGPKSDRKWHFVFYDLDASWVGYKPTAAYYLSTGGGAASSGVASHNTMINRLMANKEFRALFMERLSHHLANTFSTKNTTAVFDALIEQIKPEMKRNCERWPQLSYEKWEKNIADFREKFENKPKIMLDDLRDHLNITQEEEKKYFSKLGY